MASAFAASPLEAQSAHRDDAPAPEVKKLELNGVSALEKDEIRRSISTTASSCKSAVLYLFCRFGNWRAVENRRYLDRTELQRDVLRIRVLYYKHGYRETQVDTTVARLSEDDVAVTFDIEGAPTVGPT